MSITPQQIRAIKATMTSVKMDDGAYRELLREHFGVRSCKALREDQVGECVRLIQETGKREGWQPRQLSTLRRYQGLLGWDAGRLRAEIQRVTGLWTELSPKLTQLHFDRVMQAVEAALEEHIRETSGKWPADMQPRYWRWRNAGCSRRLRRMMEKLWQELRQYLPEGEATDEYLCGIVSHATSYPCKSLHGLETYQVLPTIEALKDRIMWASRKRASGEVTH